MAVAVAQVENSDSIQAVRQDTRLKRRDADTLETAARSNGRMLR